MSTFAFEGLTQAQASSFTTFDHLVITSPSATPSNVGVLWTGSNVTISFNTQVLTFGAAFTNHVNSILPSTAKSVIIGSTGNDFITGFNSHGPPDGPGDAIYGGPGDDTLAGMGDADTLSGGTGNDLFVIPTSQSFTEVIADFAVGDHISFTNAPVAASEYAEGIFANEVDAGAFATAQIGGGHANIVAAQVGPDVEVFADSGGRNSLTNFIVLHNANIGEIDASTFVAPPASFAPAPAAPPPVDMPGTPQPSASETLNGGSGADSLSGGPGNDQIFGRGGADTLAGGGGFDTFIIGQGESPTANATFGRVGNLVRITDWSSKDTLVFTGEPAGTGSDIVFIPDASDFDTALSQVNSLFQSQPALHFVGVQLGTDLVIVDDQHQAVVLSNETYRAFNPQSIGDGGPLPPPSSPPPPVSPPPPFSPPPPGAGVSATLLGSIDAVQLQHVLDLDAVSVSSTHLVLQDSIAKLTLDGSGFTFNADGQVTGGTVTSIDFADNIFAGTALVSGQIHGLSLPIATLVEWALLNANTLAFSTIFAGNDVITGFGALARGYGGNDTIQGSGFGQDTLFGGDGNDSLTGTDLGFNYLNGGPGVDVIKGGSNDAGNFFEFSSGDSPSAAAAGGHLENLDHILNWTTKNNFVIFTNGVVATPTTYQEITAANFDQAAAAAQTNLAHGIDYTVAQVGADVVVFDLKLADAVVLSGRTLADISQENVGGDPIFKQPDPGLSPPPPVGGAHAGATVDLYDGSDMGTFQESQLSDAVVTRSSTLEHLTFAGGTAQMSITGVGLTYDTTSGAFIGGTVTGLEITSPNGHFVLTGAHTDATILAQAHQTGNADLSTASLLSGDDVITVRGTTQPGADASFTGLGYGGNDLMAGGGSQSSLFGGDGNDTVQAGSAASSYLRGDNGDDSLSGGAGFDDINGNMGNDTAHGNAGDDWVVGGRDNDMLFGDAGSDIVWGNLGNDTLDGGDGSDQVRGGQGDDVLTGGAGDDFISGDRGNDTESGGSGADIFHGSQDAGIDRVLDFNLAEGDRVMLDPGTHHTIIQVGADTVIDMGASVNGVPNQMILVSVQLSSLTPGWIFGA